MRYVLYFLGGAVSPPVGLLVTVQQNRWMLSKCDSPPFHFVPVSVAAAFHSVFLAR